MTNTEVFLSSDAHNAANLQKSCEEVSMNEEEAAIMDILDGLKADAVTAKDTDPFEYTDSTEDTAPNGVNREPSVGSRTIGSHSFWIILAFFAAIRVAI